MPLDAVLARNDALPDECSSLERVRYSSALQSILAVLPLAQFDALRTVSQRAQMAYALSCLEAAVRRHALRGARYEEWLERAWRRTSAPKATWRDAPWPRNFAEIDELFDPPVGGWGVGVADLLRRLFELCGNTCEDIIDGRGGAERVRALVTELSLQSIDAPPIGAFLRSPLTEMGGLGREVPPAFFREELPRENFAAHLHQSLLSDSAFQRREAASAIAYLGIGSETLAGALGTALFDPDHEVCMLAETALLAIVSSWEFSEILARSRRLLELRRARVALGSDRVRERVEAVARLAEFADLDPSVIGQLRRLAGSGSESNVRCAAIRGLATATLGFVHSDVLEDFLQLLGDESEEVRYWVARTLPLLCLSSEQKYGSVVRAAMLHHTDPSTLASTALVLETAALGLDVKELSAQLLAASGAEFEMMLALLAPSRKAGDALLGLIASQVARSESWPRAAEVEQRLRGITIRWCCSTFQRSWGAFEDVGFRIVGTDGDGGRHFYMAARSVLRANKTLLADLLSNAPTQIAAAQRALISSCPWCEANLATHYGMQPLPLSSRDKT